MTMFQNILHQLWNQRRQNGWILLELIAVTFFLWTVIDPVCVLTGNRLIAPGFEPEGRYVLELEAYDFNDVRYRKEVTDTAQRDNLLHIAGLIRRCPEVTDLTFVTPYSFPNCRSWSGYTIATDTLDNAQTRSTTHRHGSCRFSIMSFMSAMAATCSAPTACVMPLPGGILRFRPTVWMATRCLFRPHWPAAFTEQRMSGERNSL